MKKRRSYRTDNFFWYARILLYRHTNVTIRMVIHIASISFHYRFVRYLITVFVEVWENSFVRFGNIFRCVIDVINNASIGRILVTKAYRDRGYGKELMEEAIKYTVNHFKDSIKIQAQQHLKAFYQAFGFKQVSTAYLDDRIWHIYMIWEQK
ncbi:GNAT family N-acetyltransferase [Virgibacillus dokdonensis]|uniref:GNAT family N-acetyltransferase n=1 Tax=Virgibacillus dokdonensis TaxID=302167 RepID=UPI002F93358F